MQQLGLFHTEEKEKCQIDKGTTVKLGKRSLRIYSKKRNREAIAKLRDVLSQLEVKGILVSQYCDFWWSKNLRLKRLQVQWFHDDSGLVLWGNEGAQVRIHELKFLYNFREQYCGDKPYYLLDFWNGFPRLPIDRCSRGHQCLVIGPAR